MTAKRTKNEEQARRALILESARWCFLNFGYSKTSLEDIAKRAGLARTLLYRTFKDKEDIYRAVFTHWLISRHPSAINAAKGPGEPCERLLEVCKLMALDPWAEMVETPMGSEFFEACDRIDPKASASHRKVALRCVTAIIGSEAVAEVFLLALDGLMTDSPAPVKLERRLKILAARFLSIDESSR